MATPRIHAPSRGAGCATTCAERPRPSPAALRRQAEDEARRSFLRTVSHELRTPLNAIIGFAEILSREMLGPLGEPRYQEYAQTILDSGSAMLALVNDILEVARLESGVADLNLGPESVRVAFGDACRTFGSQAGAHGITFQLDVEPADLHVRADPCAFANLLRRLLENAVAFSPEGGEVRLRARATGRSVRLEIVDDGPGVSPRDVHRLLRPFQQGADATATSTRGAGLGLAIANLLAKAMDGHLRLQACPGHGLTASVRLPAA